MPASVVSGWITLVRSTCEVFMYSGGELFPFFSPCATLIDDGGRVGRSAMGKSKGSSSGCHSRSLREGAKFSIMWL